MKSCDQSDNNIAPGAQAFWSRASPANDQKKPRINLQKIK